MELSYRGRMSAVLRAGDPARAAILLAAVAFAVASAPAAALGLLLVFPGTLVLRLLPVSGRLDLTFCSVQLAVQLGAAAGLTASTNWWDASAHAFTAALLALIVARVIPRQSPAVWIGAVTLMAACWESVEHASDASLGTDFARSTADTVSDLALGIASATVAAVAVSAGRRRGFRQGE